RRHRRRHDDYRSGQFARLHVGRGIRRRARRRRTRVHDFALVHRYLARAQLHDEELLGARVLAVARATRPGRRLPAAARTAIVAMQRSAAAPRAARQAELLTHAAVAPLGHVLGAHRRAALGTGTEAEPTGAAPTGMARTGGARAGITRTGGARTGITRSGMVHGVLSPAGGRQQTDAGHADDRCQKADLTQHHSTPL